MTQGVKLTAQQRKRLEELIAARPDLTLEEIGDIIGLARQSIHRLHGPSRPKGRKPPSTEVLAKARQLVLERADLSMAEIARQVGVARGSLYRLLKRTGPRPARPRGQRPRG
jgi:predicted DNA-binding protein YlxM (UPF0122 family)